MRCALEYLTINAAQSQYKRTLPAYINSSWKNAFMFGIASKQREKITSTGNTTF